MLPTSGTKTSVLGLRHLASLRALYIPGVVNLVADLLFQDWSSPRRLEASSRSGSPLMDSIWQGSDRPTCLSRDNSLQDVVLPRGSGRSTGFVFTVSRVAGRIVVCFSSIPFDSLSTQQY